MEKQQDRTPDEPGRFEEDVVRNVERRDSRRARDVERMGREPDKDGDGLPDTPFKYRVPS